MQTRTNAHKRAQTQTNTDFRLSEKGPKTQVNAPNASKRRQLRTIAKSENYTPFYTPPFTAAQVLFGISGFWLGLLASKLSADMATLRERMIAVRGQLGAVYYNFPHAGARHLLSHSRSLRPSRLCAYQGSHVDA